jgi:hypothetical protein
MPAFRVNICVLLAFFALTAIVTYPQVTGLSTSVPYHSDPYFSMWRLGWVAHQLPENPHHLFDANIFFPEHDTLAYSDAMLLPAALLAPLFWVGINPVTIYNAALFAAFALSGLSAFLLARHLTGSIAAGAVAGVIYAFAPYRFDHYMHLELQIVFWIPLALLLIHRILAEGRIGDGVLLGATMAAQALSSMYAAIFFVTYCVLFVPLLAVVGPRPRPYVWRLVPPLVVAASLTLAVVTPYALAYVRAERTVGARTRDDVRHHGASLTNYLSTPSINRLYGRTSARFGAGELYLFPGTAAIALGVFGVLGATGRIRLAYLGALIFAFDVSRGLNGVTYPFLYEYLLPFRALRAPARIGILVNLSIAILSAYGVAWLLFKMKRRGWRLAAGTAIIAVLIIEYASSPALARAPKPSLVDSWLTRQPPVVIVQLPMTRDWLYMYQGLSHRQKMLNGYSGYVPASYPATRGAMGSFPDDRSMSYLRDRGVDYVILRGGLYPPEEWSALLALVRARRDLSLVGMFPAEYQAEAVYAVRK